MQVSGKAKGIRAGNMRILSVTTMRNEGPYILEWLAHHIGAGVSDFLVYSNDCEDGTDEMLALLDRAGILTHVPQVLKPGKSIQWQALQAAWKHDVRKDVDWVLVSDVDEFLNIHVGNHGIADLLDAVPEKTDAVVIPWRLFGHNGRRSFDDEPVTQQFTASIPGDALYPPAASFFKTLFRAKGPFNQLGVHRPKQKPPEKAGLPVMVDGSGDRLPWEFAATPQRISLYDISNGRSLVEMNHYAIRSAAAFLIKRARGLPNRSGKKVDLSYWVERNFNTEENTSIHVMSDATQGALDRLRAVPGVAELHDRAVQWHKNKFEELVLDPDEHMLLARMLIAGSSEIPPRDMERQLVHWYQLANGLPGIL